MFRWFKRRPNGGKGVTPVAPGADPRFAGHFCPQPFRMAQSYDNGNLYFCCPSWLPVSPGNLLDAPIEEVWNSNWAQAVRKSILDGSYRYCSEMNCPRLQGQEDGLVPNEKVRDPYLRKIIDEGLTVLPKGPLELSVAYDPTCNLSCPSCRTELYKCGGEEKQRTATIHEHIFGKGLAETEFITISTNGDPFASNYYLSALREFDWKAHPKLRINFITNGLRLTPAMWASVANCHKNVNSIHVSVNAATPETFAINQRGGRLEKLMPNLEFIATLRRARKLKFFSLGFYVLANNFREMKEFVRLGKRLGVDSIFFGHIMQAESHTDEEFARIAVHLPGHPEHEAFLEVLRDPLLSDRRVRLSNMGAFKSGDITLSDVEPLRGKVYRHQMDWASFTKFLALSKELDRPVLEAVLAYKERVAALFGTAPTEGGDPPLARMAVAEGMSIDDGALARQLDTQHPIGHACTYREELQALEGACRQAIDGLLPPHSATVLMAVGSDVEIDRVAFDHQLETQRPLGEVQTYRETLRALETQCRAEIAALLPPPTDLMLNRLPVTSILGIDTPRDPISDAAQSYRDAHGALDPGCVTLQQAKDIAGLDEAESEVLRVAINQMKDEFTRLFSRAMPGGGPSFAKQLAAQPARQYAEVLAVCLKDEAALPGGGRLRALAARESSVRLATSLRLGAEKWRAVESLPVESLMDIRTGHDPFAVVVDRLREAQRREVATS